MFSTENSELFSSTLKKHYICSAVILITGILPTDNSAAMWGHVKEVTFVFARKVVGCIARGMSWPLSLSAVGSEAKLCV